MTRKVCFLISLSLLSLNLQAKECVILLHGLAKSNRDMVKLEKALVKEQFYPVNFDYPSRDYPIETLATQAIESSVERCNQADKVHFVTHSMGGILVRYYLKNHVIPNLGRVVMLGPPNQGSDAADAYRNFPGYKFIAGPAGFQLGTGNLSIPKQTGAANFELGIIAGSRSINLILSAILPGKDDGKVTVESTRLDGMSDHITLPVTHPFMMKNREVINQVIYFLKNGKFQS